MRINQNISAMNTYGRLNSANNAKAGSLSKLSSGLRINKAGDDAAGLAISEKMRGQVGGLKQSVRNAQDGISLIQTAEGGLNETHSILNRMRELAVQSSNDTNTTEDRLEIQKEIDQLSTEMTRIADNTEFNTQNLLNGKFEAKFHIGANKGQSTDLKINDMTSETLKTGHKATSSAVVFAADKGGLKEDSTYTVVKLDKVDIVDETETTSGTVGMQKSEYGLANDKGEIVAASLDGKKFTALDSAVTDIKDAKITTAGKVEVEIASEKIYAGTKVEISARDTTVDITVSGGINVTEQSIADAAIKTIDDAIGRVSAERSKLGATQNRLEHTINNLTATAENLSEAESRIRDVDMAEEMMAFTKNNILSQAATSMLAQANQMPQSVLQLLQ